MSTKHERRIAELDANLGDSLDRIIKAPGKTRREKVELLAKFIDFTFPPKQKTRGEQLAEDFVDVSGDVLWFHYPEGAGGGGQTVRKGERSDIYAEDIRKGVAVLIDTEIERCAQIAERYAEEFGSSFSGTTCATIADKIRAGAKAMDD